VSSATAAVTGTVPRPSWTVAAGLARRLSSQAGGFARPALDATISQPFSCRRLSSGTVRGSPDFRPVVVSRIIAPDGMVLVPVTRPPVAR
jgi:hypothetical protein